MGYVSVSCMVEECLSCPHIQMGFKDSYPPNSMNVVKPHMRSLRI